MIRQMIDRDSSVSLLYHDVIEEGRTQESGNVTSGSARYKISPDTFRAHLRVIEESDYTPRTISQREPGSVYLTFDDGGSSMMRAADMLEEYGYPAHFFVITNRIGDAGYLTWSEIDELDSRGHVIGSHTVTHADLVDCGPEQRTRELVTSKQRLDERLGSCTTVSIPRGRHDETVFRAAEDAGYEQIFSSEPKRVSMDDTQRIGRWPIWADTSAEDLDCILSAAPIYYLRVVGRWRLLTAIKSALGMKRYLRLRDVVLNRF